MNEFLVLGLCLIVAYFYGTILFAIPITKLATGKDIRTFGNTNPGTSNVFKNVGPMAGVSVAILDMSKSVVPMMVARTVVFSGNSFTDWLFIYIIGMVAIIGHCRPFWNKFKKGGGGMGTATGMLIYLVPVEFGIAILIGMFITYVFMKDAQYKFGRWVMMFAAAVVPFVVLVFNQIVSIHLFGHITFGNHSQGVVLGNFLLLALLLILNMHELIHWLKDPASDINPRREG